MSLFKRGGVWWYKFRFGGRVIRESTKSSSKDVARRAERQRHLEIEESYNHLHRREAPITFAAAATAWIDERAVAWAKKTKKIELTNIGHLKPVFGSTLLVEIGADDIAKYQALRTGKGASPKTVNLELGTLRAILRRHRLWANLQPDVRMLPTTDDRGKALNDDELKRLLGACDASRSRALAVAVRLALNTGMRRGEILNLRWRDIDLDGRRLVVTKSKTKAGTGRVVPLNDHAHALLKFTAERFPKREPDHYVFAAERYGVAGDTMEIHAYKVDPTTAIKSLKEAWETAKADAKVECRFHDLRHTAATRMLEGGIPLVVVGSILGWSPSTTARMARRYGHIGNVAQQQAVELLAKTPAAPQTSPDQTEGGTKVGTADKPLPLSKRRKLLKEVGSPHWTISATGSSVKQRRFPFLGLI